MKKRKKRSVWKKRMFILCICLFAFYCVSWKQNHGQTQGESSKKVVKHAEQVELSRPVYYEGEELTNKLKKLSHTSKKYQKIYEMLVKEFEEKYGALNAERVDTRKGWTWVENPWPWEMEANS